MKAKFVELLNRRKSKILSAAPKTWIEKDENLISG